MTWHPRHPESSTPATVGTLELPHVEADVEVYRERTVLVWRWSQTGAVMARVGAASA